MKFTIDRAKWLRGEGVGRSWLLRPEDQKQCCFGQVAEQCGVPLEAMIRCSGLANIEGKYGLSLVSGFLEAERVNVRMSLDWVRDAYQINDATDLDDATRELKLSALFADNGHELEFAG